MPTKLTPTQKQLRLRLLQISHERHTAHLGSSFSCLDILAAIYQEKSKKDIFVLSNGHAGYGLYTVLEHHKLMTIKKGEELCVHPKRTADGTIAVSTGSLGQGLPIAVGMAVAQPKKKFFCMISDGEAQEGSIWEALRLVQELHLTNLMILVNANGWGAYSTINTRSLQKKLAGFGFKVTNCDGHNGAKLAKYIQKFKEKGSPQLLFCQTRVDHFPFLKKQDAHYYVMTDQDYQLATEKLQ